MTQASLQQNAKAGGRLFLMTEHSTSSKRDNRAPNLADKDKSGQIDHEIEIKFSASPQNFKAAMLSELFRSAPALQSQNLRSIYFDTAAGDLRKNGSTLRIRKTGQAVGILNIKSTTALAGSPFRRSELEVRSPKLTPDLDLLDEAASTGIVRIIGDRPLKKQFETLVTRASTNVEFGQSKIEISFDDGRIATEVLAVPLLEIELELKSGREEDLCDLAMSLADEFSLTLDFVSKSEKGFRSITKEMAPSFNAAPIMIDPDATLDDAIAVIITNTLIQFTSNWAALRETGRPESIHQMRVALRRMRSALGMFRRSLICPEFDTLRAEAKRIATALGPARECDAFLVAAQQGPLMYPAHPASCQTLLLALEKRRKEALDGARALINHQDSTLFVLKVQSLLARREWRNVVSGQELKQLTKPAREFAAWTVGRLNARALKRGAAFPDIPDAARHELRIALKNLRYAVDFFSNLFEHRRRKNSYLSRVSKLQDLLGAHNDAVGAKRLLDELSASHGPGLETASGYILGWHARGIPDADFKLLSAWKKFKRADAFWE